MKYLFAILISLSAFSVYAESTQSPALEEKLVSLETRTSKFISGKEKMTKGYAELKPELRQLTCSLYPVESAKDAIISFKKDIALLEKKKNIEQLNEGQLARLSTQKDVVATLVPEIDCSALK